MVVTVIGGGALVGLLLPNSQWAVVAALCGVAVAALVAGTLKMHKYREYMQESRKNKRKKGEGE